MTRRGAREHAADAAGGGSENGNCGPLSSCTVYTLRPESREDQDFQFRLLPRKGCPRAVVHPMQCGNVTWQSPILLVSREYQNMLYLSVDDHLMLGTDTFALIYRFAEHYEALGALERFFRRKMRIARSVTSTDNRNS